MLQAVTEHFHFGRRVGTWQPWRILAKTLRLYLSMRRTRSWESSSSKRSVFGCHFVNSICVSLFHRGFMGVMGNHLTKLSESATSPSSSSFASASASCASSTSTSAASSSSAPPKKLISVIGEDLYDPNDNGSNRMREESPETIQKWLSDPQIRVCAVEFSLYYYAMLIYLFSFSLSGSCMNRKLSTIPLRARYWYAIMSVFRARCCSLSSVLTLCFLM